jgi:predicted phage-related endonuclease
MHVYEDIIQNTPEWDAMRLGKITASSVGSFIGVKGALSSSLASKKAMRKLILKCIFDIEEPFKGNAATEHGHEYEEVVREAFTAKTGLEVEEVGFCRHHEFGELGFSPDGLIKENGVWVEGFECKSPQIENFTSYYLDQELPSDYIQQVHYSLAVSGLRAWNFCAGHPSSNELVTLRIERDELTDKIAKLLPELSKKYRETQAAIFKLYKVHG